MEYQTVTKIINNLASKSDKPEKSPDPDRSNRGRLNGR